MMSWSNKHRAETTMNDRVWDALFDDYVKPYMVDNRFDTHATPIWVLTSTDTLEQQCEYDTERLDKYLEKLGFDLFNNDRHIDFQIDDEMDYHDILWVVVNHYNDEYGDGMVWFNKCKDNQQLYALIGLMLWDDKRTDVIKFIENNYEEEE